MAELLRHVRLRATRGGVAALMLNKNAGLSPQQIYGILSDTAAVTDN